MKKSNMIRLVFLALAVFILPHSIKAQNEKEKEKLSADSKDAKAAFIKADPSMTSLFASSYGYVIFPKISKAGLVVGGSGGRGEVYEKGKAIGWAKVSQCP